MDGENHGQPCDNPIKMDDLGGNPLFSETFQIVSSFV